MILHLVASWFSSVSIRDSREVHDDWVIWFWNPRKPSGWAVCSEGRNVGQYRDGQDVILGIDHQMMSVEQRQGKWVKPEEPQESSFGTMGT
jgi:hypothetical protein